ncbi:ATP-dependent DNA helicase [Natronobacterium gregoryi]|uniref:ATP-dependent DNA helicase n=2 Tax=Natronobacterium gregoryi TaxID=44930 RepID=L0AGA2_NATGS|nr:ATP-dependent DNA helicase [Natronobacterium gregoryi]AFZ72846.1 DNA helicase, Rad3 [Natronobacterium gregoryi SP2]ELY69666.1 helicase c2 [Natronobacterium gregoryi SP2]PLK21925.1 ATP-dependent DNA helicase [Natronobacterium gregoryi SP2]SFI65584.1 DNA excision repair protein ERCC-2 [Natronobacterium gregoryi]
MTDWRAIFGHDEPYDEQVDGIETAVETAREGGYTVVEGACGTGKTMLALTAGIDLVRDPDSDYERVFVLTSVKQQLRQFEEDLETINETLPDDWRPVSGLTLVGKADVCPYNREGAAGIDDGNVYDRCETLRDRTRDLTGEGGETTAQNLAARARSQQIGLADSGSAGSANYLETAGEPTPYPLDLPEYSDGGPAGAETEYCPFYAQYLEDLPESEDGTGDPAEAVPYDFTEAGLVTPSELVARAVRNGTCPHSVMGAVLGQVEVVVGNYYHAFDPQTTGSFTGALLDDSTFVVCDEAHMLEPRVRDLVSDGVADRTLRDAETELSRVIQPVKFEREGRQAQGGSKTADADLVRSELNDSDVSYEELHRTLEFIQDLRAELDRRVTASLDRNHRGWESNLTDLEDEEIPLRDPAEPAEDEISEWAREAGYGDVEWVRAEAVGAVVARILNEAEDEERARAAPAVGRVLGEWYRCDHTDYFREIELERTWDDTEPVDSWRRAYNARLALHNCVPSDAIGDRLAAFGGGVLMSATLEPVEAFAEVIGLDYLEREEDRPVVERRYGLHFPEENRESFAVAAPKYTYDNRGHPGAENQTRTHYADAVSTVASLPGNVLVGMPSYAEAEWIAGELESRVDKPVLLDASSDDETTQSLKSEFFAGDGKVLVTSLRGTLTEGVDYSGDRLSAAVVCGVPIVNTSSPRTKAVRRAYDDAFGDGFEYALTIPAVRKARQAIGRVIRSPDDVGVRVLLDERYARDSWDSVRGYLPDNGEFQSVSPDMLGLGLDRFRTKLESES